LYQNSENTLHSPTPTDICYQQILLAKILPILPHRCLCVQADILGYSWRAAYFIGGAPGIAVAVLLFFVQVYSILLFTALRYLLVIVVTRFLTV
jgi:hypothetical protein